MTDADEYARRIAALSPPAAPQAPEDVRSRVKNIIVEAIAQSDTPRGAAGVAVASMAALHLLATPVTVTTEEIKTILAEFGIECGSAFARDFGQVLAGVLGDRIQIAGSEGPK